MMNKLKQQPEMMAKMLRQRRKDTEKARLEAAVRKDAAAVTAAVKALEDIDIALAKLKAQEKDGEGGLELPEDTDPAAMGDSDERSSDEEDDESFDDDEEEAEDFGMAWPNEGDEEAEDEMGEDNPVAMTASLRRQMGDAAADYLDEYALTVYEKLMVYIRQLRKMALELEAGEDDDDGVNSLQEAIRDNIGRRGLDAVKPVFADWRSALFQKIARDLRDEFKVPEPPVNLSDSEVGSLLGLDDAEDAMDAADELEDQGDEAEEAEQKVAKKGPEKAVEGSSLLDRINQRGTPDLNAPLQMAAGPVSVRVRGSAPQDDQGSVTSASVPSTPTTRARDFTPSGRGTPRLE